MHIFEVSEKQISNLNDTELVEVLRQLLTMEAKTFGLPLSNVDVTLNIKAPDGGLDGTMVWQGGIANTEFVPSRNTGFQCKADALGPKDCAAELLDSTGRVKASLKTLFRDTGTYVHFTTNQLSDKMVKARLSQMRKMLGVKRLRNAKKVGLHVFGAAKIRDWVNRYVPVVLYVQTCSGHSSIPGLKKWEGWEQSFGTSGPYFPDDNIKRQIATIRQTLSQSGTSLRLVGLSGLGKSRMALEALRPDPSSSLDSLSASVVNIDISYDKTHAIVGMTTEWIRHGQSGVLVVDNCPIEVHEALQREVSSAGSRLSLLTLDANPDERLREGTSLVLKPSLEDHIEDVVKQNIVGVQDSEAKLIAQLSGGFVFYALLFCDAWNKRSDIEMVLPKTLELSKMLWGSGIESEAARRAIEACALFESVQIAAGETDEAKYIAKLAKLDADDLFRHLKRFELRGIIERAGDYIRVRPHPLALQLCAGWWRESSTVSVEELFQAAPQSMIDSLCERMRMLSFLEEARGLTKKLCGPQSPFGQAEVLTSARGARIFRSLVEINPEDTLAALSRVVDGLDDDVLKGLDRCRREWAWALERLIFIESLYEDAARVLLKLAINESESFSNNSTGILSQTFHIHLPGTQASLTKRLGFFQELFASEDKGANEFALSKAADAALTTDLFSRTSGAEQQGGAPSLIDYEPKSYEEITEYLKGIVTTLIRSETRLERQQIMHILASHLRGIARSGRRELVELILERTKEWHGGVWEEALESLGDYLRYDTDGFPPDQLAIVNGWIKGLSPSAGDLASRLALLVSRPSWGAFSAEEGQEPPENSAEFRARQLAKECASNLGHWLPFFGSLFVGEQRLGYAFGQELAKGVANHQEFFDFALKQINEQPKGKANVSVLLGFLSEGGAAREALTRGALNAFVSEPSLFPYAATVVSALRPSIAYIEHVVDLAVKDLIPIHDLQLFGYGRSLNHLSVPEISALVIKLSNMGPDTAWIGLEWLYMYGHGRQELWPNLAATHKRLFLSGRLSLANEHHVRSRHMWEDIAIKLLKSHDDELAIAIFEQLKTALEAGVSWIELPRKVGTELIRESGEVVWPLIGAQLLASQPAGLLSHRLTTMFGRVGTGSAYEGGGAIESMDISILRNWLAKNTEGAKMVAAMILPLETLASGEFEWKPMARVLIDEFGSDERVLGTLTSNLWSGSWWGSRLPYYNSLKPLFAKLAKHKRATVRKWARRVLDDLTNWINREQRELDARQMGRF